MRIEYDLLGDKSIPDEAYYGVQTARALENFHISGVPVSQYPELIRALAIVKLAAARANYECQQFPERVPEDAISTVLNPKTMTGAGVR